MVVILRFCYSWGKNTVWYIGQDVTLGVNCTLLFHILILNQKNKINCKQFFCLKNNSKLLKFRPPSLKTPELYRPSFLTYNFYMYLLFDLQKVATTKNYPNLLLCSLCFLKFSNPNFSQ